MLVEDDSIFQSSSLFLCLLLSESVNQLPNQHGFLNNLLYHFLILLLKCPISFIIFCLLNLAASERGMLMFHIVIVELSISPFCKCISFYFVYLKAVWLDDHDYHIFWLDCYFYYYVVYPLSPYGLHALNFLLLFDIITAILTFFWMVFEWFVFPMLLLVFLYDFI